MSCVGVCVLEGSPEVKGTIYFENLVRDVARLQLVSSDSTGDWLAW